MKIKNFTIKIASIAFVLILLILVQSCATKHVFLTSTVVPAARGSVSVNQEKSLNYIINISISFLAEVNRLQPTKAAYVVWMITDQEKTVNIGQLNSAKSRSANSLKVSFSTLSSFKPTKIYITAEDSASIQYPAGEIILTTDKF